jgi:hypothetical protein
MGRMQVVIVMKFRILDVLFLAIFPEKKIELIFSIKELIV